LIADGADTDGGRGAGREGGAGTVWREVVLCRRGLMIGSDDDIDSGFGILDELHTDVDDDGDGGPWVCESGRVVRPSVTLASLSVGVDVDVVEIGFEASDLDLKADEYAMGSMA
jgi:hypothetical protein